MITYIFDVRAQAEVSKEVDLSKARAKAERMNKKYGAVRYVVLTREPTLEECF